MSRTNCLRPSSGFCLNLRVRMVNSTIVLTKKVHYEGKLVDGTIFDSSYA